MGQLNFFNIKQVMNRFNTGTFFETGTGTGSSLQWACRFPFKRLISVDILETEIQRLRPLFSADPRVQLIAGQSFDALTAILPQLPGNILFWLDAHYPGAGYLGRPYDEEKNLGIRLPLERELMLIKQLRPGNRDVILIDDLRIYEVDQFEFGNMSDVSLKHVAHYESKFLYDIFKDTHNSRRFLEHTGYLALTPKSLESSVQSSVP